MPNGTIEYVLVALLCGALITAIVTDLTRREIDNQLNAGIALAAPLYWYASGVSVWPGAAIQLGVAAVTFGFFLIPFALRQMGGGDLKLLVALSLWFAPIPMLKLAMITSAIGGVLTLITYAIHKLRKQAGVVATPYGVAIALAAFWGLYERYLNHFGG